MRILMSSTVILPAIKSHSAMTTPAKAQSRSNAASGRTRVLMIDDDRELCALVRDYLEPLGYDVASEYNGLAGLNRAISEPFDVVILDVMLPGLDGLEVLKRLRAECDLPILMLTARGEEADRIVGLECGADDYLPKTFSTRELLARLRAVTRRHVRAAAAASEDDGEPEIVVGPLRIHPGARTAALGDQALELTSLEFNLLESLARARGRVKTREQLVDAICGRDYDGIDRAIDVHIWSLRKKLGDDPKSPHYIRTIRSLGYMLINPEAEKTAL